MNLKGDGKDKIISYSLLIGLLTFGLGLTSVLNELLFVQFNNSTIQSKNIEQGIFTLLFYPLVFWSLGFILHKVFKKQPREVHSFDGTGFKLNKNTYLIISGVVVLVFILSMSINNLDMTPMSSISSKNNNEKKFTTQSCEYCNKISGDCEKRNFLNSMIVEKERIFFFWSDGIVKITNEMDLKCGISVSNNFSFSCTSFKFKNKDSYSKELYTFDEKKKLTYESTSYENNKTIWNRTLVCQMR
jgi:hypothetical protein